MLLICTEHEKLEIIRRCDNAKTCMEVVAIELVHFKSRYVVQNLAFGGIHESERIGRKVVGESRI